MTLTLFNRMLILLTTALLEGGSPDAGSTPQAPSPAAPVGATSGGHAPAPPHSLDEPLSDQVKAARQLLLDFRTQSNKSLEQALQTLDGVEQPVRYEERGYHGRHPYYYARLRYEKSGITVHHNGKRITNVERHEPRPLGQ